MTQISLKITEIFYSLQGEARTVGLPTVFVRLTGCPLRCQYCDSEYAFYGGERMALEAILAQVAAYKPRYVCVTGGEPLAQAGCLPLLTSLCDAGYDVSPGNQRGQVGAGGGFAGRAGDCPETSGLGGGQPQPLGEYGVSECPGSGKIRDLRPRRLRVGSFQTGPVRAG